MAEANVYRVRELQLDNLDNLDAESDPGESSPGPPSAKKVKLCPASGSAIPEPPDVTAVATRKVQELFFGWLCQPNTKETVDLLIKLLEEGKELPRPRKERLPLVDCKLGSTPKSPVSRLIHVSATFPASPVPQSFGQTENDGQRTSPSLLRLHEAESPGMELDGGISFDQASRESSFSRAPSLSRRSSLCAVSVDSDTEGHAAIARFHFAPGRVQAPNRDREEVEAFRADVRRRLQASGSRGFTKEDLAPLLVEFMGLPSFLVSLLYDRMVLGGSSNGVRPGTVAWSSREGPLIAEEMIVKAYETYCAGRSPPARLFFLLAGPEGGSFLDRPRLRPLLDGVLEFHPGLSFLRETPDFQNRYAETVIERVFYTCAKRNMQCLYLSDIVKSRLLECLMWLDQEEDINKERRFFSYKHFYVLYYRFWQLDLDHDLVISMEELLRYGGGCLTTRIVERIFAGCGKQSDCPVENGLSYTDFVWFCLSEEDKKSSRALDYWFRCIDRDNDGIVTLADMEYFYREQYTRMVDRGHEPIQFLDIACQLLDLLHLGSGPHPWIRKEDLRACKMQSVFFNFLFNLNKFFQIESRDPRIVQRDRTGSDFSDWDRFAAAEYELLTSVDEELLAKNVDATVPSVTL